MNQWILTHSAHQKDRLNLSFVKDKHTVSKNMARNGYKMGIHFVIFISKRVYFNKEKYIETRVWVATDIWVARSHTSISAACTSHAHVQNFQNSSARAPPSFACGLIFHILKKYIFKISFFGNVLILSKQKYLRLSELDDKSIFLL